ncbi:MAG: hypothetical protein WCK39_02555 [Methanomassiliicoccales archaeon]
MTEALLIGMVGLAIAAAFSNLFVIRYPSPAISCLLFGIVLLLAGFLVLLMLVMPALDAKMGAIGGILVLVLSLVITIWGIAAVFGGNFYGQWGYGELAVGGGFLGLFAGLLRMGMLK